MAYRRKQGTPRATTFASTAGETADVGGDASSLAPPAIRASTAHRHSASFSSAYGGSGLSSSAAAPRDPNRLRRSVTCTTRKNAMTYEYTSMRCLNESKYGFWGVLARKAKTIIDDDNASQKYEKNGRSRLQMPDTQTVGQEGLTMMENRTADIIQETKKLQVRRKTGSSIALDEATDLSPPKARPQIQSDHEMQLQASRDVANAMAAKSKLLLRELKTVKADLAFAKERCTQLEEENRLLREGRQKGEDNHEDEDLIRLQLETLLEEKGRLANENSVYARENWFLREIVEYHQLTMQDVIYVDDGIEEFSEVSPIQTLTNSSSVPELPIPTIKSDALTDRTQAPSAATSKDTEDAVSESKSASPLPLNPEDSKQHLTPPA